MVEEVESLVLEASVIDDFSRTLDELSSELAGIAAQEEQVDPIEIDTQVASALAELEAVEQQLNRIDRKDVDVDVDTDRDIPAMWAQDIGAIPGTPDFNRIERQMEGDDMMRMPMDRNRLSRMGGRINRVVSQLSPDTATDLIPDLDEWRRRQQDRGPIQNIRDALDEFANLRLSMGLLMNILASLVPLLVVFVGALPAAIAGLGALAAAGIAAAGALAGVVGLGLGAMLFEGGELNVAEAQQHLQELLDTFLEAFTPLMEALRPVAETMFRQAGFFIRDMAVALEGLVDMSGAANDAIRWTADVLSSATAEAVAFAEAAMPVMSFIVSGLASFDWFGMFADIIADTLPMLTEFAGIMVAILGGLYDMSLGFFQSANAILAVLSGVFALIDAIPFLGKFLGTFISLILVAVSVTSLWSLATGSTAAMIANLAKTIFANTLGALYSYVAAQYSAAAATAATAAAAVGLMSVLTLGLAPAITGIMGAMTGVNGQVGSAADNMRRFASQSRRANVPGQSRSGAGGGPSYGGFGSSGSTTVVAPDKETGNAVATSLSFNGEGSATTEQSDVENRQHSGDN